MIKSQSNCFTNFETMQQVHKNSPLFWALLLLIFAACTSEESQKVEVATAGQEITFEFDVNEVLESKSEGEGRCSRARSEYMLAELSIISPTGVMTRTGLVTLNSNTMKTDPIFFPTGEYTVDNVALIRGSEVLYAGVRPGAPFAQFIPKHPETGNSYMMGLQTFSVGAYTKPNVGTYLLCTQGEEATSFGMPKFQVNTLEVTCFDLFFNVCDPTQNNEHFVGEGTLQIFDRAGDGRQLLHSDTFGSGNIATLCFMDNLTLANNLESYFIEVEFTNDFIPLLARKQGKTVTVGELLNFKSPAGGWETQMNGVHIIYCPPSN